MAKKKSDKGIDLTAKAPTKRKDAAWKQLGLTPEYSPSGGRKGFRDKAGNYISERQFRKQVGTPMKGSQGYEERKEAKKAGKNFRPVDVDTAYKEMQKAAKKPGMTLEEFMTGKSRELAYSERRTQAAHNKFIDSERKKAIDFKRQAGLLTEKQAEQAKKDVESQAKAREKALELRDKLNSPLTPKQRERLEKQYQTQIGKVRKLQEKLEKRGVVIMDDKPSAESLRYGYYH